MCVLVQKRESKNNSVQKAKRERNQTKLKRKRERETTPRENNASTFASLSLDVVVMVWETGHVAALRAHERAAAAGILGTVVIF